MKTAGEQAARSLLKSKTGNTLPWFIREKCERMLRDPALLAATEKVARQAAAMFGVGRLTVWFGTPKVALRGKSPAEVMLTVEGCHRVGRLLDDLKKSIDEMSLPRRGIFMSGGDSRGAFKNHLTPEWRKANERK